MGYRPLYAPEHRPNVPEHNHQASNEERPLGHLVDHPEQFPERMVPDGVVLGAISKPGD